MSTLVRMKARDKADSVKTGKLKPEQKPIKMKTKAMDLFYQDALRESTDFKSEVKYAIPPLDELVGSSSGTRLHKICFEFQLSTRAGALKDPVKGSLPITVKSK